MYRVGAKKETFSYFLLIYIYSLEMYAMHRESQTFAENENNVEKNR